MDRRTLAKTLLFAGSAAQSRAQQAAEPQGKLVPWMYMIYPLEQWLTEPRRIR